MRRSDRITRVLAGLLCLASWSLSESFPESRAQGFAAPSSLSLAIAEDGTLAHLSVGGEAVSVRNVVPFFIHDISGGSDRFELLSFAGRSDGGLRYRLGDRYELTAHLDDDAGATRIRGVVRSLTGEPAALRVRFALPVRFEDDDWIWSGRLNERRPVAGGAPLRSVVPARTTTGEGGAVNSTGFGAAGEGDAGYRIGSGEMSYYPFAALSRGRTGITLAVDIRLPVVYRLQAQPDTGLVFEYDTALSPATAMFPNASRFTVYLYGHDGTWGLRSSAEQYYRLFPEAFARRVQQEGLWLPFVDVTDVEGYDDFGFAFLETGSTSRETAERQQATGVYTFPYTEPWDVQQGRAREGLTYAGEVQRAGGDPVLEALSTRDSHGQWMIRYMWAPWFDEEYAVSYTLNPDPELTRTNQVDYVYERVVRPALANGHSGIYFDSWEFKWMYDLNYREEHFASADYPLTYSASLADPQPAIWNYTSQYEFGRFVADELHAKGKLAMGNGFEWIPFTAGLMDLFGSEIDFTQPDTTRQVKWLFRRAMAARKPVVLLLNTGLYSPPFVEPPYEGYDRYFQEALFYGFYPSFFSENASDAPYWRSRRHYHEIGRPFFKWYVPMIRAVASAGWRPVTHARIIPATLGIERFGPRDDALYLTVRSFSGTPATAFTVEVDLPALGWKEASAVELLSGAPASGRLLDGTLTLSGSIEPGTTRVFKVIASPATPRP